MQLGVKKHGTRRRNRAGVGSAAHEPRSASVRRRSPAWGSGAGRSGSVYLRE